jgi:hypothetical protein
MSVLISDQTPYGCVNKLSSLSTHVRGDYKLSSLQWGAQSLICSGIIWRTAGGRHHSFLDSKSHVKNLENPAFAEPRSVFVNYSQGKKEIAHTKKKQWQHYCFLLQFLMSPLPPPVLAQFLSPPSLCCRCPVHSSGRSCPPVGLWMGPPASMPPGSLPPSYCEALELFPDIMRKHWKSLSPNGSPAKLT